MEDANNDIIDKFPSRLKEYLLKEKNKDFFNSISLTYDKVCVYRGVRSTVTLSPNDFLSNIDDFFCLGFGSSPKDEVGNYGVSVNENLDMLKKALGFPNARKGIKGIAKGFMECQYGPATFEGKHPHHNWFLFEKANIDVAEKFEILEEKIWKLVNYGIT